jgi:hypothetical protein
VVFLFMTRFQRDENYIPIIGGESSLSATTILPAKINPVTGGLLVDATIVAGDIEIGAVEIKNSTDDTRATVGSLGLHVDPQPPTAIYNNTKTVPTGTAEAIASSQAIHSVTVKALSTNTVAVYIGATGVTTSSGFELLAGESITLDVANLASVFCISGTGSQVVRYIAI